MPCEQACALLAVSGHQYVCVYIYIDLQSIFVRFFKINLSPKYPARPVYVYIYICIYICIHFLFI